MPAIAIVMPTAQLRDAEAVGRRAQETADVDTKLIISPDNMDHPRGFTATVNLGLLQVPEDHDVLMLNDDVSGFELGWLKRLQDAMYSREDIGLIGPSGDSSTAPMALWQPGQTGMEAVRHFPFWCALIRCEAFHQVGHLDKRFIHYASDYEYCVRLQELGWYCVWLRDVSGRGYGLKNTSRYRRATGDRRQDRRGHHRSGQAAIPGTVAGIA
jgi:GT2 family glycosyltransferase